MGAREFGTAGLFGGLELHELNAGVIRVIEIELPFAVAAELRFFAGLPAVFDELLLGSVNVGHSESDVIHYAERMFVGVVRNV
jgi:hypothetical protein